MNQSRMSSAAGDVRDRLGYAINLSSPSSGNVGHSSSGYPQFIRSTQLMNTHKKLIFLILC